MTAKIKVAILGSTGMLGSMVLRYLSTRSEYDILTIDSSALDAEYTSPGELVGLLAGRDYVLNCIGVIKPRIDEASPRSVGRAIRVNATFPGLLAEAAETIGCRVLQIATDCVYSGKEGRYLESSPHDPTDVYGKTKSLGEVRSPAVSHLRCSIIGSELAGRPKDSLLEWFLGQPTGAMLKGFINHRWNGITTLAFAKICHGIMKEGVSLPQLQHVVPYNEVTKAELLSHFTYFYKREDVSVGDAEATTAVDRTLMTLNSPKSYEIWQAAGYERPPYIQQMIEELAAYK